MYFHKCFLKNSMGNKVEKIDHIYWKSGMKGSLPIYLFSRIIEQMRDIKSGENILHRCWRVENQSSNAPEPESCMSLQMVCLQPHWVLFLAPQGRHIFPQWQQNGLQQSVNFKKHIYIQKEGSSHQSAFSGGRHCK